LLFYIIEKFLRYILLIGMAMNIVSDPNILYAREAFSCFGQVISVDGRSITKDRLKYAEILLVRSVTGVNRGLLEGTPVRFVASATIGIDHVDLAYLRDNNIGFAHAPGSNSNAVAEYVISAMAHLAKIKGEKLPSLTVGIIGVGAIGSRVLRLCQALGIRCLLNDPPKKVLTGSDLYLPLAEVLRESDIVTIHVPLIRSGNRATYRLVNDDFLAAMKKGAFLVNTSRGDVMDEKAFVAKRGRLGAAALDVWENEPAPSAIVIDAADIATPHIAGYSHDGKICGTEMIYRAACAFFFMENKWRPPDAAGGGTPHAIDLSKSRDPVFDAVCAAYPIMEDDERFRKINKMTADDRPAYFDELRKNYPKRLEFRNFNVVPGGRVSDAELSIIAGLGFSVLQ
jgi:erythronate-4-phosphate dehydrogenase